MGLSDITSRQNVLDAIAEFDRLGREQFLEKYGFGLSRSYWLMHQGKRYDSKAIVGAAHGYARPDLGPLSADKFTDGKATVRLKLEELGFDVAIMAPDEAGGTEKTLSAAGFFLTWKESGWPHANILRMVKSFQAEGHVDETWRFRSYRRAKPGDRVWLVRQGSGPKGIFGYGGIVGLPSLGDAGNGKMQMMVPIRFSRLTDPKQEFLIDEPDVRRVLTATQLRAQASGYPLSDEQVGQLDRLLSAQFISALAADESPFNPTSVTDARERILRTIAQRRGQQAFREALIGAYAGKCAITGCDVLDVLEAAHIHPYRGPHTNKVSNGLLLRGDLHTLFDCGLIAVDPDSMTIVVATRLQESAYVSVIALFDGPSCTVFECRWV